MTKNNNNKKGSYLKLYTIIYLQNAKHNEALTTKKELLSLSLEA